MNFDYEAHFRTNNVSNEGRKAYLSYCYTYCLDKTFNFVILVA